MDILKSGAFEIGQKLRNKEISSLEVIRAYLDRIEKNDNKIKAFITVTPQEALAMSEEADRRLAKREDITPMTGIPIALKDNMCTKGVKTTCGSRILENFIPPYDATVVEKLKKAGAVIIGKTNMDEFAMGSSTENSAFFKTRNPWDLTRVPGGSSGGSTSAVASGETLLALGSDTGGSIRQPSAFCGVTGLKPTYGLISRYGLVAFGSSLDQIGPIARDVRDLALCLDIIAGYDCRDSTSAPVDKKSYLEIVNKANDLKTIKIGIPKEFYGEGLDEGISKLINQAKQVFIGLGAEINEVSLPTVEYSLPAYYIIAPSEASSNLARYDGCRYGLRIEGKNVEEMTALTRKAGFGEEVKRRIIIGTYSLSSGYYDAYYLKAQKVRTLIKQDFERVFQECDLLLTPSTPTTAFKIGEKSQDPLSMYLSDIYTVAVNLAGLPGISIPCGFLDELPVGLQLISSAFREDLLLQSARLYQLQTSYHHRLPI